MMMHGFAYFQSGLSFGRLEVISRRLIDGYQSFYVVYCFRVRVPNHCLKLLVLRGCRQVFWCSLRCK